MDSYQKTGKRLGWDYQVISKVKDPIITKERRRQIVEGAIRVFSRKGFHPATVDDVAREANVTVGTLYNYIHTKSDLIYLVYQYVSELLASNLLAAIRKGKTAKERLIAAIYQNLSDVYRYQDIIMFLYKESASMDRESLRATLARETKYIEMFEDLIRDYLKEQGYAMNEKHIMLLGDILSFLPVIMIFRRWSLRRRFDSVDEVICQLVEFVEKAILYGVSEEEVSDGG